MMVLTIITVIVSLYYITVLTKLRFGLKEINLCENTVEESVSIIVAARNEEKVIKNCVETLIAQDYPRSLSEIIIVDDQSTDRTVEILKGYSQIIIIQNIFENIQGTFFYQKSFNLNYS